MSNKLKIYLLLINVYAVTSDICVSLALSHEYICLAGLKLAISSIVIAVGFYKFCSWVKAEEKKI